MKSIIVALAAILGIAAATAALTPSARASRTYEFAPTDNGQG
jgi:hypothetical protein